MTDVPPECISLHQKPVFVLRDPGTRSAVRFQNTERLDVEQIHLDGCVFTGNEPQRCDWLVHVEAMHTSVFVELKGGSHPERALPQLISAYRLLKDQCKDKVIWLISRLPPNIPNTAVTLERARQAKVGIDLQMKNSEVHFVLQTSSRPV